jgi:hypothetical protein
MEDSVLRSAANLFMASSISSEVAVEYEALTKVLGLLLGEKDDPGTNNTYF